MSARNYRDLVMWQKAMQLALAVYEETACFPPEEKYGLQFQLRKAGISVPSNIAEGEGRHSKAEFHHFLSVAHGSVREIETQTLLAEMLDYLKKGAIDRLMGLCSEAGRLINGFSSSLTRAHPE